MLVLEARAEATADDRRSLALSYGSRLILERVGVWGTRLPATPIASSTCRSAAASGARR